MPIQQGNPGGQRRSAGGGGEGARVCQRKFEDAVGSGLPLGGTALPTLYSRT